jgi:hypothetical protein
MGEGVLVHFWCVPATKSVGRAKHVDLEWATALEAEARGLSASTAFVVQMLLRHLHELCKRRLSEVALAS